jgi:uncharacterized membrane protein HdeD (DUF308 family)
MTPEEERYLKRQYEPAKKPMIPSSVGCLGFVLIALALARIGWGLLMFDWQLVALVVLVSVIGLVSLVGGEDDDVSRSLRR